MRNLRSIKFGLIIRRPIPSLSWFHLDASGYHRGVPASLLEAPERILAAADVLHALREPRETGAEMGAWMLRAAVGDGCTDAARATDCALRRRTRRAIARTNSTPAQWRRCACR